MTIDAVIKQIRLTEPWNALPESAWSELRQVAQLVSIPKHQILFHQTERGGGVFFVACGWAKLIKPAPEGKETVVFLAQRGDTIGEQILGATGCYTCRAQTLTDSVVVKIDADWVVAAAQQYPNFGWTWCRFLLERLRKSEERLLQHRFNLTRHRIGSFLKEVALHHTHPHVNGQIELRLPLTHELIGEMAGVSRQQVTTIFNEWAGQGIIRYSRRQILLIKPERL